MPASYNVHPEFGFLCPTPRFQRRVRLVFACLVVAGLGAGVLVATKQEMTTNRVEAPPVAVTMPAMTVASPQGAQALAGKPGCVSVFVLFVGERPHPRFAGGRISNIIIRPTTVPSARTS